MFLIQLSEGDDEFYENDDEIKNNVVDEYLSCITFHPNSLSVLVVFDYLKPENPMAACIAAASGSSPSSSSSFFFFLTI